MTKEKFVEDFENAIDTLSPGALTIDTRFKELEEWDSMFALSIIAMVDSEYNVQINAADIRNAQTVHNIFDLVKEKTARD